MTDNIVLEEIGSSKISREMREQMIKLSDPTVLDMAFSGAIKARINELLNWILISQTEIEMCKPNTHLLHATILREHLEELAK